LHTFSPVAIIFLAFLKVDNDFFTASTEDNPAHTGCGAFSRGFFINPLLSVLPGVLFLHGKLCPWQWTLIGGAARSQTAVRNIKNNRID